LGAIVAQNGKNVELFGPRADTSNDEMEYLAMLEAFKLTLLHSRIRDGFPDAYRFSHGISKALANQWLA
jgi:ribonuclease HI